MVSIILVSLRSSLLWADWCELCAAACAAEEAAAAALPPPPLFPLKMLSGYATKLNYVFKKIPS